MREAAFELMIAELESSRLEVGLVPERRHTCCGGMVRVALSRNCAWYRRYCADHPSSRKRRNLAPDTRIKRRDTLRLLNRLARGLRCRSKYEEPLRRIAATFGRRSALDERIAALRRAV